MSRKIRDFKYRCTAFGYTIFYKGEPVHGFTGQCLSGVKKGYVDMRDQAECLISKICSGQIIPSIEFAMRTIDNSQRTIPETSKRSG